MNCLTRSCRCLALSSRTGNWQRRTSHTVRSTHSSSALTPVEKIIHDHAKVTGPLPFATYMQLCLSHPEHGYYMSPANKVFGSAGDFITSPEISQVFGELVAIWLLSQYPNSANRPPFRLVELGPGRGTLMDDILRVFMRLLPVGQTVNVHLVETSPAMRALQEQKLTSNWGANVRLHWHDSVSEIPPSSSEYTMLVAHEFFDALPIHILQKVETGWHEVLVAPTEEPSEGDTKPEESVESSAPAPASLVSLRRVLESKPSATSTLLGLSSERFKSLPNGSTLEVSPTSFRIARKIGELMESGKSLEGNPSLGGCGLIIDYGGDQAYGNSFRAFKNHKVVDVFDQPGNCDLTANVDFGYLKEAMSDLVNPHGPIPQGTFLENMGLQLRIQKLLQAATSEDRKKQLQDGAKRLVDPTGMGKEYQVMGITHKLAEGQVWPFLKEKEEVIGDTTVTASVIR